MSDYISREAAIEAFEKELSAKYNRIELSIGFVGAKSILSDLPAADVVERKKGKWIQDNNGYYVCDQCGEPCASEIMSEPRDRFCKWCGADMRGEGHE